MANARYELSPVRSNGMALICLVFQWNKQRVRCSTREYVKPEHWDKSEYRIRDRFLDVETEYYEVNRVLDELARVVRTSYNDYRRKHKLIEFTPDHVARLVREYTVGIVDAKDEEQTIVSYYRSFLNDRINSGHLSDNTLKGEEATYNHFEKFSSAQKRPVYFSDAGLQLMERFRDYLWSTGTRADSTVHKNLRRIRQVLIHAEASGVEMPAVAASIKIKQQLKVSGQSRDTIALSEAELKILADLPLLERPLLRRCRDLFLCGAYTGLRVNRWGEINAENLVVADGVKMLELFTQKGRRKSVTIPLHPELEKIFEYHDWSLPLVPAGPIINRSLKTIGREAGFDEVIELAQGIQGKSVLKKYLRYELITTHTARRSFATNAHAAGIPKEDIRAMTGQTMKTLNHYIKEDGQQRGSRIAKSDWFTKKPK